MSESSPKKYALAGVIENEVAAYFQKTVVVGDGIEYSEHRLKRRIALFESKTFPTGKIDKQGNYKYYYDIISPRVGSEVKNIDFDTKNIEAFSSNPKVDEVPNLIVNLKLTEHMRLTGQGEEINSAIEEGSAWGNVLWKKAKGHYERADLRNTYTINQTARMVNETPIIERHILSQSDLRAMAGIWNNINEVVAECGAKQYKKDSEETPQETTMPYYTLFERTGEVKVSALKEYTGEKVEKGDEEKYVLARVIAAGVDGENGAISIKYIVFAGELTGKMSNYFKEYHRGPYKGRWMREGLYEILFDLQIRGNEIGNQIAQGLQYSGKVFFRDEDKLLIQNIITDLKNGDVLKSRSLQQVEVRMQGFDQLAADWNRVIETANELANSREIVQGGAMPSGTPFRLGALLNINSNKLFDFIREKLALPLQEIFEEWIIPELVKDLSAKEVARLTGDSEMLRRLREIVVESWYVRNLVALGPHTMEVAAALKAQKLAELGKDRLFVSELKKLFEGYKPRAAVVITGENTNRQERAQTYATFIQLEQDPVRRSFLIEKAMRESGIDVGELPRSSAEQLGGARPAAQAEEESPLGALEREATGA